MKKSLIMVLMLTAAAMGFAEGKAQTTCPVMGSPINTNLYVDVEGYRIYICCKGCIAPIKAAPEKFIAKLKAEGVEPEKAPVK